MKSNGGDLHVKDETQPGFSKVDAFPWGYLKRIGKCFGGILYRISIC